MITLIIPMVGLSKSRIEEMDKELNAIIPSTIDMKIHVISGNEYDKVMYCPELINQFEAEVKKETYLVIINTHGLGKKSSDQEVAKLVSIYPKKDDYNYFFLPVDTTIPCLLPNLTTIPLFTLTPYEAGYLKPLDICG